VTKLWKSIYLNDDNIPTGNHKRKTQKQSTYLSQSRVPITVFEGNCSNVTSAGYPAGVHVPPRCSPQSNTPTYNTLRKHLLQICTAHLITPRPVSPFTQGSSVGGVRAQESQNSSQPVCARLKWSMQIRGLFNTLHPESPDWRLEQPCEWSGLNMWLKHPISRLVNGQK